MEKDTPAIRSIRFLSGALLIFWLIIPLVPLGIWSFARGWRYPDLLPQEWTLQAWEYAFSDLSGVMPSLWPAGRLGSTSFVAKKR